MRKPTVVFFTVLILVALILTGCQPRATPSVVATKAPSLTQAPPAAVTEVMPATQAPQATEAVAAPATEAAQEGPKVRHCADGLDGETITFYSQAGLTGPLSTILGTSFVNALNDSIAEINASGGICGAKVVLDLKDTQYEAAQEIATYEVRRQLKPPPVSIATYGSGASEALKDMVIQDKIPNLAAGLSADAFYIPRNGYTIGVAPIYSDQFAGFLKWLSENWNDVKPQGAGDQIVVGVIGWEGPFGAGATTPEALAYAESLGITVLPLETQAVSADADVVTPLQSLAVQGANVIYVQSLGFGTAQVIGTLHALNMWDKVVVGGNNWSINQDVLNVLGESAPAMVGYYGVFPYEYWNDTDVPGVQKALKAFEAGGYPETDKGVSYLTSYAGTFAWADIVKHAIDMFGYENLNGEAFMKAFQDLGTVDALGVFEYDVRGESRAPHKAQIRHVEMVDGKIQFVVVKDFFELPDTKPAVK
jgi:branched-chain amino acid transport system substrate-binding protein